MTHLVELWVSPARDQIRIVFDHTPMESKPTAFQGEGPEGSGAYWGFFETEEVALADARRVLNCEFTHSEKRSGEYTYYEATPLIS
jgi:hypothetical protein